MTSAFYAALPALLIVRPSLGVIRLRRSGRVAIRAHGNATGYVPISLILLVPLALDGAPLPWFTSGVSRSSPDV